MEVVMRPQVFNVEPVNSLQDNSNEGRTIQIDMENETKQGYHSSPQAKEATNDNGSDKQLTSVMVGLRRVSAVLGLLPWGATEPEASCRARTRFCLTFLVVVMVGTTFIVIESHMSPQYRVDMNLVSFLVETTYSWCLTLTSWLTVIGFWLRRRSVPSLLQQFCQLRPTHPIVWSHLAQVMLTLLPITLNFVILCIWYYSFRFKIYWSPGVYPVFLVSFSWLHALQAIPFIYYMVLGQLILDSLVANNNALTRALGEAAREMTLMEIHRRNVALRRLYGDLEQMVSLPLLGYKIFITFNITDNIYFMVNTHGVLQLSFYKYFMVLSILLTLAGTGVVCRMADNIRDQAAAPIDILTAMGGTKSGDLYNSSTWPLVPHQVIIYRLAERPLILKVGGLYPLSLTNLLSILSVIATYIIILIQFNDSTKHNK